MPIASGAQLGNYEIKSLLGKGGMGEVYLALDTKLKRLVALKLLPTDQTPSRERLSRFEREALAVSSLNHPNILTIHEISEAEGRRFISSEFVEGQSLREHMERGPLEVMEAIDIAIQVASALSAAHRAGIIHRDVKPENIMVREDGLVKVLDFGLAKLLNKGSRGASNGVDSEARTQPATNTGVGQVVGTVTYMSPEQTRGSNVDGRGDIWSLGVVLYEMITGTTPFRGKTQSDMIAAILRSEPPPLHEYASETPPELERIVARMLCKDRSLRYEDSHDVMFSLKELKQEVELQARMGSLRPAGVRTASNSVGSGVRPAIAQPRAIPPASSIELLVSEIRRHKKSVTFALFMILTGAAAVVYFTRSAPASPINLIAVLPFSNETGDENLDYLSDGLSDNVTNRLSQSSQLRLISSNSCSKYKGRDPEEAARSLGVQALVIGNVKYRADGFHVTVELVDARDMTRLWGDSYVRKRAELEQTGADISREISSKLLLRLTAEEQRRVTETTSNDADAGELYRKGVFKFKTPTEESLRKSIQFFTEAIEKDPKFARAYAGLANAYTSLGANYLEPADTYPKARSFAQKALELDDSLAEAHYSLAVVRFFHEWNLKEAEKELSRSLELNPSYAPAYNLRGILSLARAQTDVGISETKRALELDPLSLYLNINLASAYYYSDQYKRAHEQMIKVLEMDPNANYYRADIGVNYAQMGSYDLALAECQKALVTDSDNPHVLSSVGVVYALSGNRKEAEQKIEELKAIAKRKYVQAYLIALVYAALDRRDEAFTWLEKVTEERSGLLSRLRVDPTFDKIRSDPRFADLLKRTHLAD